MFTELFKSSKDNGNEYRRECTYKDYVFYLCPFEDVLNIKN